MKKILTYKGAVMTWECDSNQHMNVMYYINKYENAGRNFNLELGLVDLMDDKTSVVVLEQKVKYLQEVFEDDLIYIESSLISIANKAFMLLHEMYNGRTKKLLSTMEIVVVLFNKETRKAMVFPAKKRKELLENLA